MDFGATRPCAAWGLLSISILLGGGRSVPGATPESPEVRAMLDRGLAYLNAAPTTSTHASQLGGQTLIGMAAYKYQRRFKKEETALPKLTTRALTEALATCHERTKLAELDNYSLGIALVFLTEVQPDEHPEEIEILLREVLRRQKPNGAWGYPLRAEGDTSQLQYAALGLWAARARGLNVPSQSVRYLMDYLLRTQDPSGAWGYQGVDPGTFTRVPQNEIRFSLVAAGLGSLYVTMDLLSTSARVTAPRIAPEKLPPALRPVVNSQSPAAAFGLAGDEAAHLDLALADGWNWFRRNPTMQIERWQFYFLYGYERMESFREKVEGKAPKEPAWYNEGVRLLRQLQREDGSWGNGVMFGADNPVATAFAMLFLLRSTQETIVKVVERDGVLRGGYDLPTDVSEVRLQDNRLVGPVITGEVADLVRMVEGGEGEKLERLLQHPDALSLSGTSGSGREYAQRLARVVRAGSFEARLVAVRTLGRQGDLDNVPILIYALSDPDPRIVQESQRGLRLTARKFSGFDLPAGAGRAEIEAMIGKWKAWYGAVRPGAVFIE